MSLFIIVEMFSSIVIYFYNCAVCLLGYWVSGFVFFLQYSHCWWLIVISKLLVRRPSKATDGTELGGKGSVSGRAFCEWHRVMAPVSLVTSLATGNVTYKTRSIVTSACLSHFIQEYQPACTLQYSDKLLLFTPHQRSFSLELTDI